MQRTRLYGLRASQVQDGSQLCSARAKMSEWPKQLGALAQGRHSISNRIVKLRMSRASVPVEPF